MASHHLSHDAFFEKLGELFNHRKGSDHGQIYLTQKRFTHDEDTLVPMDKDTFADLSPAQPQPIIVRATNGKSKRDRSDKAKISTIVQPNDLDGFYSRYADVCKAGMVALKPRDRSKKKEKAKAAKKKKAAS